MNKYLAAFILSILSFSIVVAQEFKSERIGVVKDGSNYLISNPSTSISVELLLEEVAVTPGIYARYTQKYLALRAPLVAQTTYSIVDALISVDSGNYAEALTAEAPKKECVKLPVDQYSSLVLSPEDAAREAASEIFTIRKQRRDLVNGEAGEGYFGEGLKDAIASLDVMEQELMELFMGERNVVQRVKRFVFTPQQGVNRAVFTRFDSKSGILPSNDLSGAPIYLLFTPEAMPDTSAIEVGEKRSNGNVAKYRVAAPTQCALYNDSEFITSKLLPVFEFGKTIDVVISK